MAKRPISDLTRALDIIDLLEDTMARHDQIIAALLDRIEAIENQLRPPTP